MGPLAASPTKVAGQPTGFLPPTGAFLRVDRVSTRIGSIGFEVVAVALVEFVVHLWELINGS